jgi:outer membrane protein, multidrug efflux system
LQATHLEGTQAVSTVNLIRALGGGWGSGGAASNVGSAAPPKNAAQQVAKQ